MLQTVARQARNGTHFPSFKNLANQNAKLGSTLIKDNQTLRSMAQANKSTDTATEWKDKYERTRIPWVVDIITVSDPTLIRKITQHPDVDRIHGVPQKEKPW